ncbi:MAG: hypothetical protein DWQ47_10645 [Acidobacteria bacterium]|nr:MAG: hypothetical protein DWQ32_13060 [Acidobacteriota bacterium]REJ98044.1 MAG: hypothetical protein DWQ38_15860 [Acidobacteriota bacterium]REK16787.1 MAG: hypothetical protein DWQ43_00905 [Acidobacteriota bacterium]REK42698.1 MAG: hypothetical protein DWQ47_10645 [Acidobacteriota bacterium]
MNCTEVRENLDSLIDSELDASTRINVLAHIEACAGCRIEYENLRTVSKSVKRNAVIETPKALDPRILAAMNTALEEKKEAAKRDRPGLFVFGRLAFGGALLALLIVGGLAFQLGRLSAEPAEVSVRPGSRDAYLTDDRAPATKIIEVPIVEEKIVRVPQIKERIVTRTVFRCGEDPGENETASISGDVPLQSYVRDGEYLTRADLEGFQPVSEMKLNIMRRDEE